ncbi:MAG: von Willebrand factor type A domain-containing protein [Ardenticatenales bacterium]|nr:von Willebrand factor type A domain-containing protein [Ardenticatenales bacterium]
MNNWLWRIVLLLLALSLVACAGGTNEPRPIAVEPHQGGAEPVEVTVVVTAEGAAEPALMATQAPTAPTIAEATEEATEESPAATPEAEFEYYGANPYVETGMDRLSTFALDVDTASYSVARNYIMEGTLPPASAIRVEEFVNYFEQDYVNPDNVAFGIYADGAPSPFHRDGTHIMRVGIKGYDVAAEERLPTALTFVVDVSGSMSGENRLGLVKQSLQLLVERLRPDDTVAIVVYGDTARVALPPTRGAEQDLILSVIHSLTPEGSTNAEAGLRLGYQIANQAFIPGGVNRVVLCSDGVANVGLVDPAGLTEALRGYADAGITLTSVGVGMSGYNDVLMEQLANDGDGNYAYIDTLEEAKNLFVDNLTSTLQVIALNAKVQVDFNPDVVARYRLLGYENRDVADQAFRDNTVDAGEIGAGHTVTALYAVEFYPNAAGRVATVQLRWEDPQTHEVRELAGEFNSFDMAPSFDAASLRYQLDVVVAQYAEVLRYNPEAMQTSLSDLRVRAERLAAQLPADPDVTEFAQLVERATLLQP